MKKVLKLSLSLLGNQVLGFVGSVMCIISVNLIAGDTIYAHLLFLLINLSFFIYIEYRAAFTSGFHDADRRNNCLSKKYIWKGALAGVISIIPLLIIISFFLYAYFIGNVPLTNTFTILLRISAMYYVYPMLNILPNHMLAVVLSSVIVPIVVPMLGYIAGYKNYEWTYEILKIRLKKEKKD